MPGVPQIVAAAVEATKDMEPDEKYAALTATASQVMSQMPPRENPRLNKSLDSVHASGPLGRAHVRHPRQPELQADRCAAGLRGVRPAAAAAEAGRVRLGLPGLRPPRAARRAAQLRPGVRAGGHGRGLSGVRLVGLPRQGRVPRTGRALPDHGRRDPQLRRGAGAEPADRRGAGRPAASRPGDTVAILSANDPVAFTMRLRDQPGRRGLVPDQPAQRGRREPRAARPVRLHGADLPGVVRRRWSSRSGPTCPQLTTLVCLDGAGRGRADLGGVPRRRPTRRPTATRVDDLAMIVGTGGTTGRPKGVLLTGTNLETMTAITLMSYPFEGRPVYLALAPLTHAAGVLCFPVLALGGEIVVMRTPDVGGFLEHVERHRVTHTFLPPTLIYMVLAHPDAGQHGPVLAAVLLVRRGADVGDPAGGGADPDRSGDGAAVRPDRGADDDLDDAAARPLPRRRERRPRAAVISGATGSAGDGLDHGRGRRAAAPRRARRDRGPQLAGDGRLPPRPGGDRGRPRRTAGTTPATSATSTTTTSSSSSTGPRTW